VTQTSHFILPLVLLEKRTLLSAIEKPNTNPLFSLIILASHRNPILYNRIGNPPRFTFFITFARFAKLADMATVIILQDRQIFRGQWKNIRKNSPHGFALLASTEALRRIGEAQKAAFDRVVELKNFGPKSVVSFLESNLSWPRPWFVVTNDEYCLRLAAGVRQHFGLPGHTPEQIDAYTNKLLMKQRVAAAGIPVPSFVSFDRAAYRKKPASYAGSLVARLGLPLIVKPADETNSRNVYRLEGAAELNSWCAANLVNDAVLEIEEYIEGSVFFCDTAFAKAERCPLMVCEYVNPPLDFDKGFPHGSITLPEGELYNAIAAFADSAIDALGKLDNCVIHVELFRRPSGEFVFLEAAARAPEAFVSDIGEIHTGINFEELNFLLQTDSGLLPQNLVKSYGAWMWFPKRQGIVAEIHAPILKSANKITLNIGAGDRLKAVLPGRSHSADDACCTVTLWNKDAALLREDFEYLRTFSPLSLENDPRYLKVSR
jgi:hypothetical protein